MDDTEVDRILRSALKAGAGPAGPHPEPEELFAYHVREASPEAAERIQAHLAGCPECTRVVLDFAAYPHLDAPSEDDVAGLDEIERGWADVQARLSQAAPEGKPSVGADVRAFEAARVEAAPANAPGNGGGGVSVWQWAAAALLLASLGLSAWVVSLRRELGGARVNVAWADLMPEDNRVRSAVGPAWPSLRVPARATRLVLHVVHDSAAAAGPAEFAVEIVAEDGGHSVLRRAGLVRLEPGTGPTLELPPDALAPGRYRLRLYAHDGGPVLAEYPFELTFEEP